MEKKDYWLKDIEVKSGVRDKKVISSMIIELGEKLIHEMMLEKYRDLVEESIDKSLLERGFTERTIYRSKSIKRMKNGI